MRGAFFARIARSRHPLPATPGAEAIGGNPVHLREYDLSLMAEQIGRPEAGGLSWMNDFPGFLRRRKLP